MNERDSIIGKVTKVLDESTFEIEVTEVGMNNKGVYDSEEKIQINKFIPPEIITSMKVLGTRSKTLLERMLKDGVVMCLVDSRESNGEIKAEVHIF